MALDEDVDVIVFDDRESTERWICLTQYAVKKDGMYEIVRRYQLWS